MVIRGVERLGSDRVKVTVDVAADVKPGPRRIAYRAQPGPDAIVLYDSIDYIRILPEEGFARIGGVVHPKQLERFEAWAMHHGADGKPYTDDDLKIRVVDEVEWELAEFPVRPDDDDVKYVGVIDPDTGVFTPGRDGPNPKRKWQANNVGDVYVMARTTLRVRKRPEPKKPEPVAKKDGGEKGKSDEAGTGTEKANGAATNGKHDSPKLTAAKKTEVVYEEREFRARAHLLVTVPRYVRYDVLEWERSSDGRSDGDEGGGR